MTILIVYVHDIIVIGNDSFEIKGLKDYLGKEFEIEDPIQLSYFLEIKVAQSKKEIFLSQRKYVLNLF